MKNLIIFKATLVSVRRVLLTVGIQLYCILAMSWIWANCLIQTDD